VRSLRIQLWSYNYDPEPTGIAPLSTVIARELQTRGHHVSVVAAHPHYPAPVWGTRRRPYREERHGIPVLRLPLWVGRRSAAQRIRQELSFVTSLGVSLPFLPSADVMLVVSPSFPALGPAMLNARLRRTPWVLWLQDILPDGAAATGMLQDGFLIRSARRLEHAAYRSASRIIVISDSFRENLVEKGVPAAQLARIYNPASLPIRRSPRSTDAVDSGLVLTMGNIGHTQNLVAITRAFEGSEELAGRGARFVLAGEGVAADDVRKAIKSDRVALTGVVGNPELASLLSRAALGVVSQRYEGFDFNVPSKLMNFMGQGIPTVASVREESEVARILRDSGGGWVTGSPEEWARALASALGDEEDRKRRGAAALRFAQEHFSPGSIAQEMEAVLQSVVSLRS
jgi:colanic acid biosynthesis glycosyl transferase WcaI